MPYDVRLGRIKLPSVFDDVSEDIGDAVEVVGDRLFLDPVQARPMDLTLPVYGALEELDPYATGERLRRQVRALLTNSYARAEGVRFSFAADAELDCWLVIGGGELAYADGGPTLAEYQLSLRDTYVVARARTHRLARIAVVRDLRLSTTSRDPRRFVYSTAFAGSFGQALTTLPAGALGAQSNYENLAGFKPVNTDVGVPIAMRRTNNGLAPVYSGRPDQAVAFDLKPELSGDGDVVVYATNGVAEPKPRENLLAYSRFAQGASSNLVWLTTTGGNLGVVTGATLTGAAQTYMNDMGGAAYNNVGSLAVTALNQGMRQNINGPWSDNGQFISGQTYTASIWVNPGASARQVTLKLGTATSSNSVTVLVPGNTWTQVGVAWTSTVTTQTAEFALVATTTYTATLLWTYAQVTKGVFANSYPGYFDNLWGPGASYIAPWWASSSHTQLGRQSRHNLARDPRGTNWPFQSTTVTWNAFNAGSVSEVTYEAGAPQSARRVAQVTFGSTVIDGASLAANHQVPGWYYTFAVYARATAGTTFTVALYQPGTQTVVASTNYVASGGWDRCWVTAKLDAVYTAGSQQGFVPVIRPTNAGQTGQTVLVAAPLYEPTETAPTSVPDFFDGDSQWSAWDLDATKQLQLSTNAGATAVQQVDPQTWGWEEVYSPDYAFPADTFPVLENGVVRVTYDSTTQSFSIARIDPMSPYYVERARVQLFNVTASEALLANLLSASDEKTATLVEWTPERAVVRFTAVYVVTTGSPTSTVRYEVYVTLQRGWNGVKFDVYSEVSDYALSAGRSRVAVAASIPRSGGANMSSARVPAIYPEPTATLTDGILDANIMVSDGEATAWTPANSAYRVLGVTAPLHEPFVALASVHGADPPVVLTTTTPKAAVRRVSMASMAHGASQSASGVSIFTPLAQEPHLGAHLGVQVDVSGYRPMGGDATNFRVTANATQVADATAVSGQAVDVAGTSTLRVLDITSNAGTLDGQIYVAALVRARVSAASTEGWLRFQLTSTNAARVTSQTYAWYLVRPDADPGNEVMRSGQVTSIYGHKTAGGVGNLRIDRVVLLPMRTFLTVVGVNVPMAGFEGIRDLSGATLVESRPRQTMVAR